MITYKDILNKNNDITGSVVLLDNKVIGHIRPVVTQPGLPDNWQYWPKNCSKKFGGNIFVTLASCKRSLEEE